MGGMGTSSASAIVWPISIAENIQFNHIRMVMSMSYVSSTVSGQHSYSSVWGIYSNNAGTLSQISSGSYSMAMTVSSVSATLSFPTGTGTTGYAYGTVTASATAQAQSLFGTAGWRDIHLQFGNSMSLTPGLYYFGIHQRQTSVYQRQSLATYSTTW
jgi:hypothetical protein